MPEPFREINTFFWTFLICLFAINVQASYVAKENTNAGINTVLFLCSADANSVDLFSSLDGNPDSGGFWTESSSYGVNLDDPNAVDISFLPTGTYSFIYTIPETLNCPQTSAVLTIHFQITLGENDVSITTYCDDNNTPSNTFDDTFSYTILVNGPSTGSGSVLTGSGFIVSSDPSQLTYPYNTIVGSFGSELIDDGRVFITISDVSSNGICISDSLEILPPENCSECNESVSAEASFPLACTDPFVLLTGSGSTIGTYSWTGSNGFESNIPNPTVSDTGTYVLTIFFDNGCVASDSVYVSSNISIPDVNAGENITLDCTHLSTQLNGIVSIDNPIIEWTSNNITIENSTSLSPIVSDAGWYFLNVTNPVNGCSNMDSVFVQAANMIESADINVLPTDCNNPNNGIIEIGSIIGGTEPFLFSINNEAFTSNSTFENLSLNNYSIGIEDSNGCSWDTLITLENSSSFLLELGQDLEISLGDSVQIHPFISIPNALIDTIVWINEPTLSCLDCLAPFASPATTTTYSISVENTSGCIESDEITIFVDQNSSIYIPNAFSPNNDGVNDFFQIYSEDVLVVNELNIYDRWGNQVYRTTNFEPSSELGWDGTFRGQIMNPAVFIYYVDVTLLNGQNRVLKGDITLVR